MADELYKTITPLDRWLITLVVMAATLIQVIDTTIINVALPHMQGALSASSDEITWTLTSYLVSSAIFMPLTGYFADRFGRKKFLFICITGFTITSGFCGAATTLPQIVFFRLLQGVFGASLVPLSQAILADIFPPEDRGKAMAIWGLGVMVGPVIGPTLGGYLTDMVSWRWTFYVNVPVGLFTLSLIHVIPDSQTRQRKMDWLGLLLISTAIGCMQYILDRGNQADWFAARSIRIATVLMLVGIVGFIIHNIRHKENVVFDLSIFKDRNFLLASFLLCIFCLSLYGTMVIYPLLMEGLLNYPALTAGLMISPRGISGMISMLIVGKLINRYDPRWLIALGIIVSIYGIHLSTQYSLQHVSMYWLIVPMTLQGFGMGLVFVPLSTVAFSTLANSKRTEAAGLFSLLRTIGGSIGISIVITLQTRNTQYFWNMLGGYITPYRWQVSEYLKPLHLSIFNPKGTMILAKEIAQQATMLSFINVLAFIMWCFVFMLPLVFLLKRGQSSTQNMAVID